MIVGEARSCCRKVSGTYREWPHPASRPVLREVRPLQGRQTLALRGVLQGVVRPRLDLGSRAHVAAGARLR